MKKIDDIVLMHFAEGKIKDEEIKKIISKQASREERLSIADDVILNNRTLDSLKEEVIKLHKKYIKMLNHG